MPSGLSLSGKAGGASPNSICRLFTKKHDFPEFAPLRSTLFRNVVHS